MLHAYLVVLLIGLGDSLNPTTLGPAMYLVTVEHPRRQLAAFLVGLLSVNLIGGALIMLGPGQLILDLVPKPKPVTKHIIEVVAGVALLAIAISLWSGRKALGRRKPPTFTPGKRSGVMLGAGIAVVELPTALPYFAAIAVIVGSGAAIPGKVAMLVVYNLAFVFPILAILAILVVFRDAATEPLARFNRWVLTHWPGVLAGLAALIGASILGVGVDGLLNL
jgi:cytochrome c biogenesis protein CcdA